MIKTTYNKTIFKKFQQTFPPQQANATQTRNWSGRKAEAESGVPCVKPIRATCGGMFLL